MDITDRENAQEMMEGILDSLAERLSYKEKYIALKGVITDLYNMRRFYYKYYDEETVKTDEIIDKIDEILSSNEAYLD